MATGGDRVSADPPIVGFDFINDDDSRTGILVKHAGEQIGNATDKRGLLSARCTVASDPDVDVRHAVLVAKILYIQIHGTKNQRPASTVFADRRSVTNALTVRSPSRRSISR